MEPPLAPLPPPLTRRVIAEVSWKAEYAKLAQEIQVRHYSPKALKIYTQWLRHYQTFTRSVNPKSLTSDHLKGFLTFPAVDREARLSKEFGTVDGVVKAKRKPYIPVVLSRDEIEAVLRHPAPPFNLVPVPGSPGSDDRGMNQVLNGHFS